MPQAIEFRNILSPPPSFPAMVLSDGGGDRTIAGKDNLPKGWAKGTINFYPANWWR
jgi:hypothetical protein